MQYRTLGSTGIRISTLAFGAGPISTLMVGDDAQRQADVVAHALAVGVNWFDTAATYGAGQSERSLGGALAAMDAGSRVHVATKVRFQGDDLQDIGGAVRRSLTESLERLQLQRVTLLQIHNSITRRRGDEPTSITPTDVLGPDGVLAAFRRERQAGRTLHIGITGLGQPEALSEVIRSGQFETMQVPYHLLNPSAGQEMPAEFSETNYGNVIGLAAQHGMGVLTIRALAGGALAHNPPSPHTLKTPFFPLDLYLRDCRKAELLLARLGPGRSLVQEAIRFAASHPHVHAAIVGLASPQQIDEAVAALEAPSAALTWKDVCDACETG